MTIKSYFSDKKPENGSYILGNQNHVGWYLNGYVYYWAFDCQKGYPRRTKLKDWCDAWLYLKPCCLASSKTRWCRALRTRGAACGAVRLRAFWQNISFYTRANLRLMIYLSNQKKESPARGFFLTRAIKKTII